MKCPACSNKLTEITEKNIALDVCRGGCGGIWFDATELERFDEVSEEASLAVLRSEKNKQVFVDNNAPRNCPCCISEVMHRYYYDSQFSVEVDQCLSCNGIWLDLGELEAVRKDNKERAQRDAAIDSFNKHVEATPGGKSVNSLRVVFELIGK